LLWALGEEELDLEPNTVFHKKTKNPRGSAYMEIIFKEAKIIDMALSELLVQLGAAVYKA